LFVFVVVYILCNEIIRYLKKKEKEEESHMVRTLDRGIV